MSSNLWYALLPEQLLLLLMVVLMLVEILRPSRRLAAGVTLAFLAGATVLLGVQLQSPPVAELIPGELVVDRFAVLARLSIVGCGLLFALSVLKQDSSIKFWLLVASSLLGGMLIMVSAGAIGLFLGIEMMSLPVFALIILGNNSRATAEGAIKYLILSSAASAMILFGISLGYAGGGSLALATLTATFSSGTPVALAGTLLLVCGLCVKTGVFPFHAWTPDAYGTARMPVTTFMASMVKLMVVLSMLRIFGTALLPTPVMTLVAGLGVVSVLYGNLTAIGQQSFRRLLAYSSIAHAGYMIFALTDTSGSRIDDLIYYAVVYGVTTIVATSCVTLLTGNDDRLEALDGTFRRQPLPALLLGVALLSLAGIPPFPGFLGKFFIFKSAILSGQLIPAVIVFAGSFIGVTYYLRAALRLFVGAGVPAEERSPWKMQFDFGPILIGFVALMIFMLVPGLFHGLIAGP